MLMILGIADHARKAFNRIVGKHPLLRRAVSPGNRPAWRSFPERNPSWLKKGNRQQANYYDGIMHVVYISTNIGTCCEHCDEPIGLAGPGDHRLAESINHYIEKHGYKLLHVGTETTGDSEGSPWHTTVALLGTTRIHKPRKIRPLEIVEDPSTGTVTIGPLPGRKRKGN